jgi:hypothetical protein
VIVPERISSPIGTTAIFAALFASIASMSVPTSAARASDCHAEPNSDAPDGSQWRYHTDRERHRKCWYLRPDHADHSDRQPAKPATSDAAPAPPETPSAMWKHHPDPVSDQELEQDKTKCETRGNSSPVGVGSPEFKFYLLFSECMRTAGYELVPPPQ